MSARATVSPPSPLSKIPIGRAGAGIGVTVSGHSAAARAKRSATAAPMPVGRRRDHEHDVELAVVGLAEPRVEHPRVLVGVGGRAQDLEARPGDRRGGAIASRPTRCAARERARRPGRDLAGLDDDHRGRGRVVALERARRGDLAAREPLDVATDERVDRRRVDTTEAQDRGLRSACSRRSSTRRRRSSDRRRARSRRRRRGRRARARRSSGSRVRSGSPTAPRRRRPNSASSASATGCAGTRIATVVAATGHFGNDRRRRGAARRA